MFCFKGIFHLNFITRICYNSAFLDSHERETPTPRSFTQIRPRAEELCPNEDLKIGELVFVNYNMEESKERGLW